MTTASSPYTQSDVTRVRLDADGRDVSILEQDVFLSREGDELAARGLGIDIAGQRGLTGANCGFLFWAVSAPFHCELIGINDCVELPRKTKSDPHTDRLFERLRKHSDLLGSWAGTPAWVSMNDRYAAAEKFVPDTNSFQEVPL
ncbi:hypothetical protein ABID19_000519 [Mesorhizobium robiniae]|uniref:Uncharacterized protein n=1 Tax=Mesorhizobium robiniae TaxID=559315 RepID=A0ABV2GGU9_9HYPH